MKTISKITCILAIVTLLCSCTAVVTNKNYLYVASVHYYDKVKPVGPYKSAYAYCVDYSLSIDESTDDIVLTLTYTNFNKDSLPVYHLGDKIYFSADKTSE